MKLGLLAKIVTTLDILSGGRAMLGIGAGDDAEEAVGVGLPFRPPPSATSGGERRTLPLVARYADACNVPPTPELPRRNAQSRLRGIRRWSSRSLGAPDGREGRISNGRA